MDDLPDTNHLRIGRINRKETVNLTVTDVADKDNPKETAITAYKGETLLAALMAAGFKSMKLSPLNHEPRGGLCGMGVCFECMVTVDGIHNIRSCMLEVEDNMKVTINEQI